MLRSAVLFHLLCVSVLLSACSPGTEVGGPCASTSECASGAVCIDGHCEPVSNVDGGAADGALPSIVSLSIEPPSAMLVSTDGSMPTVDFEVTATFQDGTVRPAVAPIFELDARTIGDIDVASGLFTANGVIGGSAIVTATVMSNTGPVAASAMVSVRLERTIYGPGVPADVADRFVDPLATDPTRETTIVYPLEGAVMPQNVFPADVQWLNGVAGDLFRVRLDKPSVSVVAYLVHDGATFRNDWLVDATAWRSLAQTDPDAPMTVAADRWEAASSTAVMGTATSMRFARAALTGAVYYWDIAAGRIIRINDGTAVRDSFMPSPPVAIDGNRCVGCHTVSPSGRYMAGRLGGGENIGAVFDLTTDLSMDPPPTVYPISTGAPNSQHWWFSTWSPDETRMAISIDEGASRQMRIMDPFAGVEVTVSGSLPSAATHPAWAPDGSAIAYASEINQWGGDYTSANISTLPWGPGDAVGAPTVIHRGTDLAGATPPGDADSYPSWTPDSRWIAFAHGTGCRSEIGSGRQVALYIMGRDGTAVVALDRANGGTVDNFQPRFSPFDSGGYFWLSFLSRRDYGNAWAGTRGANRQQIWVTAIRNAPDGTDPSEVGYWLPGQDTASMNISAYWAPRPCRPDAESCSVGSECCSGDCRPDSTGAYVCSPTPPDRCRMAGETCSSDASCCEGLVCLANVCVEPPS